MKSALVLLFVSAVLAYSGPTLAQQQCSKVLQLESVLTAPQLFKFEEDRGQFVFPITKKDSVNRSLSKVLMKAFGISRLNEVGDAFVKDPSGRPFFQKLADATRLKIEKSADFEQGMRQVPTDGPLIIVMNHPLSGSEAIGVAAELSRIRPDVKVALTYFLKDFPEMNEGAFFLNPYGGKTAANWNHHVIENQILPHLREGKALLIFPSGEVSQKDTPNSPATEKVWKSGTARLIEQVPESKILPIYIHDEASSLYYAMKRKSETSRFKKWIQKIMPVLHIREITKNVGRTLHVSMSKALDGKELSEHFRTESGDIDHKAMMAYLKDLTFSLREHEDAP